MKNFLMTWNSAKYLDSDYREAFEPCYTVISFRKKKEFKSKSSKF